MHSVRRFLAMALVISLFFAGNSNPVPALRTDAAGTVQVTAEKGSGSSDLHSLSEVNAAGEELLAGYHQSIASRKNELSSGKITIGSVTMQVKMQTIGKPGAGGYPLYIGLHGGASGDKKFEDDQFSLMANGYYSLFITSGVYVATRGLTDIFDQHFRPESFQFYDRIIEDAIAFHNVDPNRVYLMGFSSGGDGVYMIAPKIAERLAGANMSAGFPHSHLLENLYNMPMCVQVGDLDTAFDRHLHAADYDSWLADLQKQYDGGFPHETFIHVGGTHNENWSDLETKNQEVIAGKALASWRETGKVTDTVWKNTSAISWMKNKTRNPLPKRIVWNTGEYAALRNSQMFYWLDRDGYLNNAVVVASYDTMRNQINIERCDSPDGTLKVYLKPGMVDVFKDVKVNIQGQTVSVRPIVSRKIMEQTLAARGDVNSMFTSEIDITFDLKNNRISVTPVGESGSDYSVKGAENLLYWDAQDVFYVDRSLLGASFQDINRWTGLNMTAPVQCPWEDQGVTWTYTNDLEKPGVCFFFGGGKCFRIYSEQSGTIPQSLKTAVSERFGARFTVNGLPTSNVENNDMFVNGGTAFYSLTDNFYDGAHHIKQQYEVFG